MFLIIETASSRGLVVLCDETKVLASKEFHLGLGASGQLEPGIDLLFCEAKKSPAELQYVAVGVGPGSYTGIRVGVSSAKALSFAFKIPLVGISSLHSFLPPADFEGSFLAAIDAKIGGVYVIEGKKQASLVEFMGHAEIVPFEIFEQKLAHVACLVTPAFKPLEQRLTAVFAAPVYEKGPSGAQMAIEAQAKFQAKEYSLDGTVQLLYLRATQAEMEKLPNKPPVS